MKTEGPPRSPQSWEHLLEKDPNTSAGVRIGFAAALGVHAVIFAVTWPTIAQAPPAEPAHDYLPLQLVDIRYPEPPPPDPIFVDELSRPEGPPVIAGPPEEIEFRPTVIESLAPPPDTVEVVGTPIDLPDPPDPPRTIVREGVEVDPPEVVHRVEPRYTEAARVGKIQGVVILDLIIDTDGRVESVQVLRDLPLGLTRSAVEAVEQWRFEPSTYRGRPVAVQYVLTIRFSLT